MDVSVLMLNILRGLEVIAGWWLLFYLGHRPPTKGRRVALVISFFLCYTGWYIIPFNVWLAPGTPGGAVMSSPTANVILWDLILVYFAFLCGRNRQELGDSLFTAFYYIGIEACLDVLRAFINAEINGRYVSNYPQYNVLYLVVLGWTIFYHRIRQKCPGRIPPFFQILTVVTPLGTMVLLTRYADVARLSPEGSSLWTGIYREGIFIGIFLLILNFIMFYLYVKLLRTYEIKSFAMEVAETPPVWTEEGGLSEAFVVKYGISKREREVLDALLLGKTYQEIGECLFISPKTVEIHLRHIYDKTKTSNRFALYTLIKG